MTATIHEEAELDLERAFKYYQDARTGLGAEFLQEYRRGLERILAYPKGWQALDQVYRRYRLHRFPYGIVYRVDEQRQQVVIVAVMHMARKPGSWRRRAR